MQAIKMAGVVEEIITPSTNKARAWKHFGYVKDSATGKLKIGKKVTCRLCRGEVSHSGGTSNLKNHLRHKHLPEYR